jgi:hypothetical protein
MWLTEVQVWQMGMLAMRMPPETLESGMSEKGSTYAIIMVAES